MLPERVDSSVARYLRVADRVLPERVVGFYVVGSTALGAYNPDHSDIDVVVVLDRDLDGGDIRRLRLLHLTAGAIALPRAIVRRQPAIPGTINAAFVRAGDLSQPVSTIEPVAAHTGHQFAVGRAFDVNPVVWKILAERGIAVRGPEPATLGLQPEPELLRAWNLQNLDTYWRGWGRKAAAGRRLDWQGLRDRWAVAWGVLGVTRLHYTVASGEIIAKEAAGEHALATFDAEWHPIIREALAYLRDQPPLPDFADRRSRTHRAGEFVLHVVDSAHALPPAADAAVAAATAPTAPTG